MKLISKLKILPVHSIYFGAIPYTLVLSMMFPLERAMMVKSVENLIIFAIYIALLHITSIPLYGVNPSMKSIQSVIISSVDLSEKTQRSGFDLPYSHNGFF